MRGRRRGFTVTILLATALVAGCGDDVNEGVDSEASPEPEATIDSEPDDVSLPSIVTTILDEDVAEPPGGYNGFRGVLQREDGTWLGWGFDDDASPPQPEPGALWTSDDLVDWDRVDSSIDDDDGQQIIASVIEAGEGLVAVGASLSLETPTDYSTATALAWRSTSDGKRWTAEPLPGGYLTSGMVVLDGELLAFGIGGDPEYQTGLLWSSTDDGRTWEAVEATTTPTPRFPIDRLPVLTTVVEFGDVLVGVTTSALTDPNGGPTTFEPTRSDSVFDLPGGPADVTLWTSADRGRTWSIQAPDGLAGVRGFEQFTSAHVLDDRLVLVGARYVEPFENFSPEDFEDIDFDDLPQPGFITVVWNCDQALSSCWSVELDDQPLDGVLHSAYVGALDGYLVVSATTYGDDGRERLYVVDPTTGTSDSTISPISQVATSAIVDDQLVLFGRVDKAGGDLRVVAITLK